MKKLLTPLRVVLGGLFIFSGLVKLNDPVGTAIKLEEYFEVFAESFSPFFETFIPLALPMSLVFCVAEVVLGLAVLIRYRMRVTMWLMLLLIIFFTFLTFYSAYFNKVTDCGCFGDFIKLTPWTSFGKDIFLLVITVIVFAYRNQIPNILPQPTGDVVILAASAMFGVIGWYAIVHLPYADWRPYFVGAHIPTQMKSSEAYKYEYTMERGGERKTFSEYPEDTTWKYVEMKLLNPEAAPKITDYRLWNDEGEYTDSSFHGAKLMIIVQKDEGLSEEAFAPVTQLIRGLGGAGSPRVDAWVLTSMDSKSFEPFRHRVQLSAPFFYADATVLKTIMRTKVGTWLLKDGKVIGKWSFADTPTAEEVRALVAKA